MSVEQGTRPGGLGGILSPPDQRDFELEELMAAAGLDEEYATWVPPASYAVTGMPPVLNQGDTPMCVAYSHSTMKAWQDRRDQGKFFDFDEPYFFRLIGGTSMGAVLRNALDRMRIYGYPVASSGQASLHKIASYYAVTKTKLAIQTAIHAFGPLTLGVHWYNSWFYPYENGVLRPPDYGVGGHAIVAYGWDSYNLLLRNSWGVSYGVNGDVKMPWWMVLSSAVGEIWKSVDVTEVTCTPAIAAANYPSPRVALIAPHAVVYGYNPNKPGGPVAKFVDDGSGSRFKVTGRRVVSWPGSCPDTTVPHGTFLIGYDGVFKGLLVPPSQVKAADGKSWY
jgi:hypothetical protein